MSFLSDFFGGGSQTNPADVAMPYLDQIPDTVSPYYQPFIDKGTEAGDILSQQYSQLAQDPSAFYNQLMSGYEPSDAYQYQADQLQKQMAGTAAAGGFTGTDYDQQQQAEQIHGLLSQDQQQYLQNLLGMQQTGLQGEQNLYGTGAQASMGLGDILGSNLAQQGSLAYQGQAAQNQANVSPFSQLLDLGAQGVGAYFGMKGR